MTPRYKLDCTPARALIGLVCGIGVLLATETRANAQDILEPSPARGEDSPSEAAVPQEGLIPGFMGLLEFVGEFSDDTGDFATLEAVQEKASGGAVGGSLHGESRMSEGSKQ